MRLAFKNKYGSGWTEREVPITLNMGAIETLCRDNGLIFGDLGNDKKISAFDFRSELLFYGYLAACKDRYEKPRHTKIQAILWNEHLSESSRKELQEMMNVFYTGMGEMIGVTKKKVVAKKVQQTSPTSGPLPSESSGGH